MWWNGSILESMLIKVNWVKLLHQSISQKRVSNMYEGRGWTLDLQMRGCECIVDTEPPVPTLQMRGYGCTQRGLELIKFGIYFILA